MKDTINQYLAEHGFGRMSTKAVLFDMDGVLYDSMPNHAVAWQQAMADYGLDMSREDAYRYEGMRGVETIRLLARRQWHRELDADEAATMYAHKSERFAQLCTERPTTVMPGARRLMEKIKAEGTKICVVTGSAQHALLDRLLVDFAGLLSRELVVTAYDVRHGKPDPEPYIKGMEKCGTAPQQTVVVENAPLGVRAAVAAHCLTVAVNSGPLPAAQLSGEGAAIVYDSMTALSDDWEALNKALVSQSQ